MGNVEAARAKIEEARAIQASERNERRAAYLKLVNDTIVGNEVEPDDVLATIEAAGVTFEQFENHVALEQSRRENQSIVETLPDFERRKAELKVRHEKALAEIAEFNRKMDLEQAELIRIENEQRAEFSNILRAQSFLQRSPEIAFPEDPVEPAAEAITMPDVGFGPASSLGARIAIT
ncbi:MAG: hypothetical protein C0483_14175 [Pirellula sp.]|nr:hypothetical protein [Pirellula sp.]